MKGRIFLLMGLLLAVVAVLANPGEQVPVGRSRSSGDSLLMDVGEVLDDLLVPEPYYYQSAGLRDPFAPLVGREDALEDREPGISDLVVVGVLWAEEDRFALVETKQGKSMILREGDEVSDGVVLKIHPDGVTMRQSRFGIAKTVWLPVTSGLEAEEERAR